MKLQLALAWMMPMALTTLVAADSDALRDLGTNAAPGEIPKWDGSQWRNAHDDITTVIAAGPGIAVTGTNKSVTISLDFGVPKTNATVATYQEMDATRPPVGAIVAWAFGIPGVATNLPSGWVRCEGQTLADPESPLNGLVIPNLNGAQRFLMGGATSGTTGGASSHNHQWSWTYSVSGGAYAYASGGAHWGGYDSSGSSRGMAGNGDNWTDNRSQLPPYYQVVWIMRVK